MKRKVIVVTLLAVIAVAVLLYLQLHYGIQTLTTDKDVYLYRENISVIWSEMRLNEWGECGNTYVELYKKEGDNWKGLSYGSLKMGGRMVCVNGKAELTAFGADLCYKGSEFQSRSGNFTMKNIYERVGEVSNCIDAHDNSTLDSTLDSFVYSKMPPVGEYKLKFGSAEKIFRVTLD
jgi:hypothetical protein